MGLHLSVSELKTLDTVPKRVQYWSQSMPDHELFVFYNGQIRESYTSRQVLETAGKFASRLRKEYGFKKGDIIVNTLPNSPERLFTDLGITLAGCVSMNGVTMFSDGLDFLTAARNSCLSAVVVTPEGNSPAWRILEPYAREDLKSSTAAIKCDLAPDMKLAILAYRHPKGSRRHFFQHLLDSTDDVFVDPDVKPDDIMYVFTTSGTTGYCKPVPKSHADVINGWSETCEKIKQDSNHTWINTVCYNDRPLGWMGGFPFGTYVNADTRILLDVFDTQGSKIGSDPWGIICREKADYSIIMPLDLDYLLKQTDRPEVTHYKMKLTICAGQPIRKNQYLNYYKVADEVAVLYGSTEAGFLSFGIIPADTEIKDYYCHQLKSGIEMRIIDEKGRDCKTGQVGTILVKGPNMFKGYLNRLQDPDPKTVTSFTKDGWFIMEDSGYFDEDQNLYVLGRLKDIIIFGATNVYPGWLEPKIADHPDVIEACVVPVSDPVLCHNICAVVKSVPGSHLNEHQLRTYCTDMFLNGREVEGTPVPAFYLILDEFPRTSTGKVDRVSLQKLAEDKFGSK